MEVCATPSLSHHHICISVLVTHPSEKLKSPKRLVKLSRVSAMVKRDRGKIRRVIVNTFVRKKAFVCVPLIVFILSDPVLF